MITIGSTLKALRRETGLSQIEVAEILSKTDKSVTNKAVSKWEAGSVEPNIRQFLTLCNLYGVIDPYAMFADDTNALNTEGWLKMREYAELLRQIPRYTRKPITVVPGRKLPVYELPASAGTGQFLDSDQYEMVDVDNSVPMQANFGIRVAGDSMEPQYHDGDVVWVQQQPTIEEGEVGIFLLNGEAYIKVFSRESAEIFLLSLNKGYAPIMVSYENDFRVFGRVLP